MNINKGSPRAALSGLEEMGIPDRESQVHNCLLPTSEMRVGAIWFRGTI